MTDWSNDPESMKRWVQEQSRHVTTVSYSAKRLGGMAIALWRAREGTLEPDWRERLEPEHANSPLVHEMYRDADELAVADLREMPPAAWEPFEGKDWREALEAWYFASLQNLAERSSLAAEGRERGRVTRIRTLIGLHRTLRTSSNQEIREKMQGLIDQYHQLQPTVDRSEALELAVYVRDRAFVDAWYRAGLAAGGEPVDWIGWYQQRIAGWADQQLAARAQESLDDAGFRAEFASLPHYWKHR